MSGFNNSARRDDVSMKLRSQDFVMNMRHTRDQTKKLEEESRKMEDRLKELKTAMSREKEERERQGGGFWGRGQTNTGSLTSYASEVLQAKVEKPVKEGKKKKIKILQDEPIEVPQRSSQPGTVKYIAQRKLTGGSTPRDKQKGPKCGQCEERSATLSCVQCSEIYCAGCFAAFHLKGALKQHRSCPISAQGGRVCMSPRPSVDAASPRGSQASGSVVSYPKAQYPVDGSEASGPRSAHSTPRQQGPQGPGASLLRGDYDESQSAASFQQALMAWRQGDESDSPQHSARKAPPAPSRPIASPVKDPVVSMDSCTGTTQEESKVPEIKFKGSLSYVEKLMLKKHRRTELSETGTPRLTDQSESSSRLSDRSDWSSVSRHSHHQRERIGGNRRDDGVASPLPRRSYNRGGQDDDIDGHGDFRERSFIDDGERVDFQSLYEAVVSTEGSGFTTPRSDFSVMDVTSHSPKYGASPPSKPSYSSMADQETTGVVSPYDTWATEDMKDRLHAAQSGNANNSVTALHSNNNHNHNHRHHQQQSSVSADPFVARSTAKPNAKYSIEDMYPSSSSNQQQPTPSPPPPPQQQPNSNHYMEEDSWDVFAPITPITPITPNPMTSPHHHHRAREVTTPNNVSSSHISTKQQRESSPFDDVTATSSSSHSHVTASGEATRPKSRQSKSRAGSARPKTASKSRPASRAQSRAASRMMVAEGLLTKTPSKALSEVASLAKNSDDVTASTTLTYQSPLEGFFLAGVDLAKLADQAGKPDEERTITPSKFSSSSTTSLAQQGRSSSSLSQRPKSRGGPSALKSARGDNKDVIKVSNRLYQMAPRSWRPDSSLGETIPMDAVHVEATTVDEDDMVLSYSYGGQMSGRGATQWRPSSSQSNLEADNQFAEELALIQQSSSQHPIGIGTSASYRNQQMTSNNSSAFSRSHTPAADIQGQGDRSARRSAARHSTTTTHQPLSPSPSPQPRPSLPVSSNDVSTSSARRKSANRRSLGSSVSSSFSVTPTPMMMTSDTPQPTTPDIPVTPKTPIPARPLSSSRTRTDTSASLRRSKLLHMENQRENTDMMFSQDPNHSTVPRTPSTPTTTGTASNKKSHLMGNGNLLPSKSEIPFAAASRSKSKMAAMDSSSNNPGGLDSMSRDSMSRSDTQTSGIVRTGSNMSTVSRGPGSRPASKNSKPPSVIGGGGLSRRRSDADQTQQPPLTHNQRPNSSTVVAGNKGQTTPSSAASRGRPVSSTVSQDRVGRHQLAASQSVDLENRQDSIIADVMSTRVHHADGWMMGDDDNDDDNDDGGYDDDDGGYDDDGGDDGSVRHRTPNKLSDSSHWETEVRPFTRDSLDSASAARRGGHRPVVVDAAGSRDMMGSRPSSTMSGRESRAIVMDGEDLSVYDTVMLDPEERNHDDDEMLERLEWELASDTGRLTADGQISRMGGFEADDHSGSTSRSSSSRSLRFCADKDYDLTSKLLEAERIAEQVSLNVDLERNVTLDEDEVKALR